MRKYVVLTLVLLAGCASDIVIHQTYPHDTEAFTQGLEFYNKTTLVESTGLYGQSSLRKVDIKTGTVLQQYDFPDTIFAEGLTYWNNTIIVLSWKENTAFYFDESFNGKQTKPYAGEGWGLTDNGTHLFMSNGSSQIQVRDPVTFNLVETHTVTVNGEPVNNLNELEWVNGTVYANIWKKDTILAIDTATYEAEPIQVPMLLTAKQRMKANVLNGIAHRPGQDTFLITGKNWPTLFNITIQ